jgi:hypothetical protein
MPKLENIKEQFPFLTVLRYGNAEYVSIIQNTDSKIMSFYDYSQIISSEEKNHFLDLGGVWWWESNRKIPINLFLPNEMKDFRYCLKHVSAKEVEIIFGPCTSILDMQTKRTKRRQIQLVRRIPRENQV